MLAGNALIESYHRCCPITGLNVQGFVADDPADDHSFEPVTCNACTRVHLVNPKAGKLISEYDD